MDIPAAAQVLASGLGRSLGLDGLAFDPDDGTLTLELDDSVLVSVGVDGGGETLTLFAPLTAGPFTRSDLVRRALEANFLWRRTGGATLAIEPESGQLVLHRHLALAGLQVPAFATALEGFAGQAAAWSAELAADGVDASVSDGDSQGVSFDPEMFA
ncbi:MAG TPA: type III secretion system chaperone [Geminicoccaceae bacterium]|nr:type III secretion system chaperone [Geminicoccus sp.]HMU48717.1 type III secretion system chaperone [Geminicoccaceae bacterium]